MGIGRRHSALRPARVASLLDSQPKVFNPGAVLPLLTGCTQEASEASATVAVAKKEGATATNNDERVALAEPAEAAPARPPAAAALAAAEPVEVAHRSLRPAYTPRGEAAEDERAPAEAQAKSNPVMRLPSDTHAMSRALGRRGPVSATPRGAAAPPAPVERLKKSPEANSAPAEPQANKSNTVVGVCSDLSRRTLHDRVVFWYKRLRTGETAQDLIERYTTAKRSCELSDWLAERTFLGLLETRLSTEGDTRAILNHFADQPDVRNFIASRLLRRSTDARIIAVVREVLFGSAVDWLAVERSIQGMTDADKRISELRTAVAKAPNDPEGSLRLLRELARAGRIAEALALGQRVRDSGLLTPELVRRMGDLLAHDRQPEQAQRVYSELVEFAPDDRNARQMLGDIYLGKHWHDAAYRQYQLLTELNPDVPLFWLRLAMAAAGSGRTDEALRLERRVAAAEGTPGPDDPRRLARLLATNQLATLLFETQKANASGKLAGRIESISRELRELGLLSSPGRLVIAAWLDPTTDFLLMMLDDKNVSGVGELVDASSIGLQAVWLNPRDVTRIRTRLIRRSVPAQDPIDVAVSMIDWDGKAFKVERRTLTVPAEATSVDG